MEIGNWKLKRFAFFGTPHFSVIVLRELLEHGLRPDLVVTSPDKPVGRKKILTPSPVKVFAMKNHIPVVETHHDASLHEKQLDFGILVAYGKIIPRPILDLFPHGILNIHPSLLPKYRGASPIPTAILSGDRETGVTIIKINEKVDAGEIIFQEKIAILPTDTTLTLGEKLFSLGAKNLVFLLPNYLNGKIKSIQQQLPQFHVSIRGTMTKKLSKQDGFIELSDLQKATAPSCHSRGSGNPDLPIMIDRKFRAFAPWPGIWTVDPTGKRILITKCHLEKNVLKIDTIKKEGFVETRYCASILK